MSNKRRVHPITMVFNFVGSIKQMIYPFIASVIAFARESLFYFTIALSVVLIAFIIWSFFQWYQFTYRIVDDELIIEYGVFIRKKRTITKGRIQSIDLTESVLHRMLKLVKVQIETSGGGKDAEASLQAVHIKEGERVQRELRSADGGINHSAQPETIEHPAHPSLTIPFRRLLIAGITSGSIGILFTIAIILFSQLDELIPEHLVSNIYHSVIGLGIMMVIFLIITLLFLLWLIGIAGTMIKYGRFTITKRDRELFITRGLLEKRRQTIPLNRVQAIGIDESLLRQPFGYATIYAEVASATLGDDYAAVLCPIIKKSEIPSFLHTFFPDCQTGENRQQVEPPKQALKYYLLRATWFWIVVGGTCSYFWPGYSWIAVVFIILTGGIGVLRYRDTGYRLTQNQLTIQFRKLNRQTIYLFKHRIQAFERKQGGLQRAQDLATAKISILSRADDGTHYKLKDIRQQDVWVLANWFRNRS